MRLTYDPRHNIACIRSREESAEVETLRIAPLAVWNEQLQLRKQISVGEA
jgi:hypothetical protein